jgi:hypothetical protein
MMNTHEKPSVFCPVEDPWDVFIMDEYDVDCEPEYGDFWGEPDDDCDNDR